MTDHLTAILEALQAVQAARRDYQAMLDESAVGILMTPTTDEREHQTVGAVVRELNTGAQHLEETIRALRRLKQLQDQS